MRDKIKEAKELLIKYNEWRRGGEGGQPNPYELGQAIDCAIECMADIGAKSMFDSIDENDK
tara:strand:- start:1376 stop:1558 length:183 start_codon:yes stop_codon:yes gene_type:complete